MGPSDAKLIEQVLAGEQARYEELVRRHLPLAYGVAYAQTLNHADAEDTVQDTFIKAWRKLETLREPSKFAQWLSVIARNSARSIRRRRETRAGSPETSVRAITPDPAREELHGMVREHLAQLPEDRREVLVLYYFAGLKTSEIAEKLGISRAAAKKRLQRAREEMGANLVASLAPALEPKEPLEKQSRRVLGALGVLLAPVTESAQRAGATGTKATGTQATSAWLVPAGAALTLTVILAGTWLVMRPAETAVSNVGRAPTIAPVIMAASTDQEQPASQPETLQAQDTAQETSAPVRDATEMDDETILDEPVSLQFENAHLFDVLHAIETATELTILYDAAIIAPPDEADRVVRPQPVVVEDPYVTNGIIPYIQLTDVPLRQLLRALVRPLGLEFVAEPGRIWISTSAGIREEVPRHAPERFERYVPSGVLDETASIQFENTHVYEILQFITETYDINILLDFRVAEPPSAFPPGELPPDLQRRLDACPQDVVYAKLAGAAPRPVTTGVIPRIQMTDARIGDTLAASLRSLNLAFTVRDGLVWISAPALLGSYATYEEPHFTAPERISEVLSKPVSLLFEDIHLYEYLGFVTQTYDLDIAVDFRVVEPPCEPDNTQQQPPQINRAYTTTGVVPWLNLKDVSLGAALFAVLHPLDLVYELNGETLIVSSEGRLAGGSATPEPLPAQ